MTFALSFLYTLVILPVEGVIESVFYFVRCFFEGFGVAGAVAAVSLAVSFLTLPIYNVAEAQQLKERELRQKLSYRAERIKRAFKGDERFMILSTYYRLNHYHPAYALREAASTLIQVPFFIAAYHFLSNCLDLREASFLAIGDLSSPDRLLALPGGLRLNLLPVLMTAINAVSGAIYTRGAPPREKLQVYGLALIFLVLLYGSPSGLVLYWTLNNLFSLAKNAVKAHCRRPWLAVEAFIICACVLATVFVEFIRPRQYLTRLSVRLIFPFLCVLASLALPLGRRLAGKLAGMAGRGGAPDSGKPLEAPSPTPLFIFSCAAMAALLGLALPASMIASSPEEFSFLGGTDSPLAYVWSSFVFAVGLCLLWPAAIYLMMDGRYRPALSIVAFLCASCMISNSFAFKHGYGNVSITGTLDDPALLRGNGLFLSFVPLLFLAVLLLVALLFCLWKKQGWLSRVMVAVCLSLCVYGAVKARGVAIMFAGLEKQKSERVQTAEENAAPLKAEFHLSKTGRNVFTIFLDRGIGLFVPYVMQQFPELAESYRGFTLYPNTLSYSSGTIYGSPGLYGGYEYTPDEINKRHDELLNAKTNESQLVLPRIFSDAGWSVTVTDPESVWYDFSRDFGSDFLNAVPDMNVIYTNGKYNGRYNLAHSYINEIDKLVKRHIPRFFVMQALYPPLRFFFYAEGRFVPDDIRGDSFLDGYAPLYYLDGLTDTEAEGDTYTIMHNFATHNVWNPLVEPDYHYQPGADSGEMLLPENIHAAYPYRSASVAGDLIHYECNAAALLRIGIWLDRLRELGVYDNTRIIIVGDHGFGLFPRFYEGFSENYDYGWYHTILMVKDFGADGEFKSDGSFMTNADTPYLTLEGLGLDMTNPFTGKEISNGAVEKSGGINVEMCLDWRAVHFAGKTQFPIVINQAYHVSDDIYTESNWIPLADWLKTHPEDMPEGVVKGALKGGAE